MSTGDGFRIEDSDLRRFIFGLSGSDRRIISHGGRYVRKLGKYAERKMKQFAKAKTNRSKGELSSSIKSDYIISNQSLSATIYVPASIKYQFAAEYGIKRRFKIYGSPKMTFPTEHWKKARRGIVAESHRGYFVFYSVNRGRYKGRFYTKRAYEALIKFYDSRVADSLPKDLIGTIAFGR
jgi:hypothetical protein